MNIRKLFECVPFMGHTFCYDPFTAAAAIGALGSIFGSAINSNTSNKNTDKMIAAQKEENERYYQESLAQWQRENDYNTPSAQVARLRAAGLNPALAYGTPNISAPSPQPVPADMSAIASKKSVFGSAASEVMNANYMTALIDNLKSQSNKNNADAGLVGVQTNTQRTYNTFQDALLKGQLQEQDARISLNWSLSQLHDAKSLETYRNCDRILADIREINQGIQNMKIEYQSLEQDVAIKRIIASYKSKECLAAIKQMMASANALNADAKYTLESFEQLLATREYNIAMAKTKSDNLFLEGMNLSSENDILNLEIEGITLDNFIKQNNLDMTTYENRMKAIDKFVDYVSSFTGAYRDLKVGQRMMSTSVETEATKTWNPSKGDFDFSPVQKTRKRQRFGN